MFGHGRIAEDRPRSNFSERVAANLPRPAQGPGQDQKGWLLTIHDVQLRQWEIWGGMPRRLEQTTLKHQPGWTSRCLVSRCRPVNSGGIVWKHLCQRSPHPSRPGAAQKLIWGPFPL